MHHFSPSECRRQHSSGFLYTIKFWHVECYHDNTNRQGMAIKWLYRCLEVTILSRFLWDKTLTVVGTGDTCVCEEKGCGLPCPSPSCCPGIWPDGCIGRFSVWFPNVSVLNGGGPVGVPVGWLPAVWDCCKAPWITVMSAAPNLLPNCGNNTSYSLGNWSQTTLCLEAKHIFFLSNTWNKHWFEILITSHSTLTEPIAMWLWKKGHYHKLPQ